MTSPHRPFANLRAPLRPLRLLLLLLTTAAHAHIGSPDTFVQAAVGPYAVLLAVHPPSTSPGALELDLRFNPDDRITSITAALDDATPTPVPLVLDGTATASIWSPNSSAHTLHIAVQGSRGPATYTLTLPATPSAKPQPPPQTLRFLLPLSLLLLAGAFLLVIPVGRGPRQTAFVRWGGAKLLHPYRRPISAVAFLAALALACLALKPTPAATTLTATLNGPHLDLTLNNPHETFADLAPDHGKLLHLFLVREPQKDVLLHLHPRLTSTAHFTADLPAMPPGTYTLFADFYHADARNETATLRLTLPQQTHTATTDPDDSTAVLPPLTAAPSPSVTTLLDGGQRLQTFHLRDHYTLTLATPTSLHPLHANLLQLTLLDPTGQTPADMQPYLGMAAHAVVLRSDDAVFAHIHPGGTLPMLMSAAAMQSMPATAPTNTATVPYGFPTSGRYRLFVQMKHGHLIETAAFDLDVN